MRIRPERVAHLMRREVADILANRMRDPRISSWVSVIDVEVTGDLSFARVFVSILDSEHADQAMQVLQRAAGFVRRELAPRLGLREVPEIRFLLDRSIESGARVEDLLRKISQGEPLPQDDEDDEKQ
jgi:ribosome-binding factor A